MRPGCFGRFLPGSPVCRRRGFLFPGRDLMAQRYERRVSRTDTGCCYDCGASPLSATSKWRCTDCADRRRVARKEKRASFRLAHPPVADHSHQARNELGGFKFGTPHCAQGHKYTSQNSLWTLANGKQRRECRECNRLRMKRRRETRAEVRLPIVNAAR